ncbi:hypothetical protein [Lactiplantibacillus paraxiangfangensis]|uniref:hypothetical protein n=1 Tax=Lactiplantibacillus paraxiangfangensis TaxID=3076224 RepID=UPI0030C6E4BB
MINVALVGCSKVATDGIGRAGGVGAAFFCWAYTTDGPGQLRFLQVFRARGKTAPQA